MMLNVTRVNVIRAAKEGGACHTAAGEERKRKKMIENLARAFLRRADANLIEIRLETEERENGGSSYETRRRIFRFGAWLGF